MSSAVGGGEQQQIPNQQRASVISANPALLNRKSHNIRALGRKAISFQQRQVFTNVCCISLCPLMMVAISALLGSVIEHLILQSQTIEDVLFCSNSNSLTPDGFPYFNFSEPGVYSNNQTGRKETNYLRNVNLQGITGNPGASTANFIQPCVFWFGEDYPQFSSIYEKNANLSTYQRMDSTLVPPPDGGWLNLLQTANFSNNYTIGEFNRFAQLQQSFWAITGASSADLTSLLGTIPYSPIDLLNFVSNKTNFANLANPNYSTTPDSARNGAFGLLGAAASRLYFNISSLNTAPSGSNSSSSSSASSGFQGITPVPYFVPNATTFSDLDLDDALTAQIQVLLVNLAALNKTVLQSSGASIEAKTQFYINANKVTAKMPYGAIFLDQINPASLYSKFVLHFGSDKRLAASANFPTAGKRMMAAMTSVTQATLKYFGGQSGAAAKLNNARITQGVRAFPNVQSTGVSFQFGGVIGRILYPFGVSFLLPIFVIVLVKEKEERIFVMMKMNGMKLWAYYLSHYVTFYVLFAVSTIIFLIAGIGSKLTMFTLTEKPVLLLVFFVWGHVQIVLAFFFAALFSKSRIALVLTFLIVLCGVIISLVTDQLFQNYSAAPAAFFIWPPFAFYRCLSLINGASYTIGEQPYKLSMIKPGNEVSTALLFMFFEIFVYGALALYLQAVFPSEFGTRRPWHFPVTDLISYFSGKKEEAANLERETAAAIDDSETSKEDADVKAERERVDKHEFPKDSPLIISHMRKVYPPRGGLGPKIAVKDVTLAVEEGIVFGLLGPNGAGKTTLISILTGLYEASHGSARLAGLNSKTQLDEVYKIIGICPQFDILWEDLTVSEHLYFYARLKGIDPKQEREAVLDSLNKVSLSTLANRRTKTLSGGEKRRLSIAIALVGGPAVVFLDEPTTGLDPEVRRLIWNIIQDAKEGKTIVLTTHSMEEAEAVCQRIGIMAKGTLRCLANPLRLKELYGSGFKLFFNSKQDDTAKAAQWIESQLPTGWRKVDAFATNTSYEFPIVPGVISYLFREVEKKKAEVGILDWGISQTTLEEVFLKIISDDDANAD